MKQTLLAALAAAACLGLVTTLAQNAGGGGQPAGAGQNGTGGLGPGQIRPRPAEGREPEFPPPNIREYKPHSTLVVAEHKVPRAKFPVVDFHGHPPPLTGEPPLDQVVESMSPLNLQVMIDANSTTGDRLRQSLDVIRASKYKNRMVMFT